MKLLFDENLSPKLVGRLNAEYPDSSHVELAGLRSSPDRSIWEYAREQGFALVSKDDDFRSLSLVHGAPPKVIWLSLGNASTSDIAKVLADHRADMESFAAAAEESLLVIRRE